MNVNFKLTCTMVLLTCTMIFRSIVNENWRLLHLNYDLRLRRRSILIHTRILYIKNVLKIPLNFEEKCIANDLHFLFVFLVSVFSNKKTNCVSVETLTNVTDIQLKYVSKTLQTRTIFFNSCYVLYI